MKLSVGTMVFKIVHSDFTDFAKFPCRNLASNFPFPYQLQIGQVKARVFHLVQDWWVGPLLNLRICQLYLNIDILQLLLIMLHGIWFEVETATYKSA